MENLGGKKKKVDVITCRQKEFNHFHGQSYPKFQPLPLASGKWHLSKLKGDYFTIHPVIIIIQLYFVDFIFYALIFSFFLFQLKIYFLDRRSQQRTKTKRR